MLGAYSIDDYDMEYLGYIKGNEHDDYYKLCRYLNNKAYIDTGLNIPIFYMNGQTEPYDFWMGHHDDYVEYDKYGEPIYSGIYFRKISDKEHIIKATKNQNLPDEIWEGELNISTSIPIKISPSGPKKKIYKDGVFVVE